MVLRCGCSVTAVRCDYKARDVCRVHAECRTQGRRPTVQIPARVALLRSGNRSGRHEHGECSDRQEPRIRLRGVEMSEHRANLDHVLHFGKRDDEEPKQGEDVLAVDPLRSLGFGVTHPITSSKGGNLSSSFEILVQLHIRHKLYRRQQSLGSANLMETFLAIDSKAMFS